MRWSGRRPRLFLLQPAVSSRLFGLRVRAGRAAAAQLGFVRRLDTMHIFTPLIIVGLALLCGCAHKDEMRFTKGTGDMGQFVMQQALKRDARPVATNGLPAIAGDWSYSEDQFGVVFHLSRERFPEVQAFLLQA